jgi:hypothetical protein
MGAHLEVHGIIDSLTMSPASFADTVLDTVKKMAMAGRLLAPDRLEPKKKTPSERFVQVDLDESFRKEKAIERKESRKTYVVDCDISILTLLREKSFGTCTTPKVAVFPLCST